MPSLRNVSLLWANGQVRNYIGSEADSYLGVGANATDCMKNNNF